MGDFFVFFNILVTPTVVQSHSLLLASFLSLYLLEAAALSA